MDSARALLRVAAGPPRALEAANRACALDPSDPDPHLIASRVHGLSGNSGAAVRAGQEALYLAPMDAVAHANLATALASRGGRAAFFGHGLPRDLRVAAEHARHAMALSPLSTVGHFAAGFVAAASGRPRQARTHYRRVLAINPQSAPAINNLAMLDLGRGRVALSGSGFARALGTDPSLGLARRNVRGAVLTWLWRFHCLAWVIYVSFSGEAANEPVVDFTLAWSTRCTVACWLVGGYVVLAAVSYLRADRSVRDFAKSLVTTSWSLKLVALADVTTLVCFVASTLGRGPTATNMNLRLPGDRDRSNRPHALPSAHLAPIGNETGSPSHQRRVTPQRGVRRATQIQPAIALNDR